MAVKLGSARIDENGHAKGGKAGDQTGKEVSTQSWYKHSKGWRVFRAVSSEIANKIAWDMQAACNNNNIGYDQSQRLTLYEAAKPYGFNCKDVTKKCETDCSALVRVCCAYAGVSLPNFRTTNEASVLLKSGKFVEMTGKKYTDSPDYLRRGDILVTKTQGHTVVVLSNGKYAEQTDDSYNAVLVTGKSVNIRNGSGISNTVIGIAHKGDIFDLCGVDGTWYRIPYKSGMGYISNKYSTLTTK